MSEVNVVVTQLWFGHKGHKRKRSCEACGKMIWRLNKSGLCKSCNGKALMRKLQLLKVTSKVQVKDMKFLVLDSFDDFTKEDMRGLEKVVMKYGRGKR
jgi:hypothetical protein